MSANTAVIFSARPESRHQALNNIRLLDPDFVFQAWLEDGVGLLESALDWTEFAARTATQAMFVRHIQPVERVLKIEGQESDLDLISASNLEWLPAEMRSERFSVQTRLSRAQNWPYKSFNLNRQLSDLLVTQGGVLDVKSPEWVLSVYLSGTTAMLGSSRASENLSHWTGGMHRFKKGPEQISRAEFKLLEALASFDIDISMPGRVLDLGAAPGGWTRIMLEHGWLATAVDPAKLDPRLMGRQGLIYKAENIRDYQSDSGQFDFLLNDMRMDMAESVAEMLRAAPWLKPGAVAIMTLKLPGKAKQQAVDQACHDLSSRYAITGVRQLFHNRSEVTVALAALG